MRREEVPEVPTYEEAIEFFGNKLNLWETLAKFSLFRTPFQAPPNWDPYDLVERFLPLPFIYAYAAMQCIPRS